MKNISETMHNCSCCPAAPTSEAAAATIVRLGTDGMTWYEEPSGTPVHLAVLFRDPGIADGRTVPAVLDLRIASSGILTAGKNCWVKAFLKALPGLPVGITVALDNGVRCPCPKHLGVDEYCRRVAACHSLTVTWHATLHHPDGSPPGIMICDMDLACSLSQLGHLTRRDCTPWRCPSRFLDSVGDEVAYLKTNTLIAAHPAVLQRSKEYQEAFVRLDMVAQLRALARFPPATDKDMSRASCT